MLKKKLYGFKYGNNTYVSNENIDLIKKLCSNMKIEYIGQSLGGIFKIILKDVIGNEVLPKSTHNKYVFDTLKIAKKNRARRGAIKDLDELKNKENERFSKLVADGLGAIDCNNASAGTSNDYLFRNAMRDIHQWIHTHKIWDETNGWSESDELKVLIGWTSPTSKTWSKA